MQAKKIALHGLLLILMSTHAVAETEFKHCFDLTPQTISLVIEDVAGSSKRYVSLDTGSTHIALDNSCSDLLTGDGTSILAALPIGSIEVKVQKTIPFILDGYRVSAGLDAVLVDCSRLKEAAGYNFVGLIGYPVLKDKILDIDPDASSVRILESLPLLEGDLASFTRWSFELSKDVPYVTINIGNSAIRIMMDTGGTGFLSLSVEDFGKLTHLGFIKQKNVLSRSAMIGKISDGPIGIGMDFPIDKFMFSTCEIDTADSASLGMEFMRNFRIIFDYKNKFIYLKPANNYKNYRPPLYTGIHLHMFNNGTYIQVDENSNAYSCGLRDGFKLLEIQGKIIQDYHSYYFAHEELRKSFLIPITVKIINLDDQERLITLHK